MSGGMVIAWEEREMDANGWQNGRVTRRRAMVGGATVLGSAGLAACGAGTQETAGTAPKTQGPVTLRYVASFGPSGATTFAGGLTKLVDTYNAKGTPVQVQPITPTGNRNEAALTMI